MVIDATITIGNVIEISVIAAGGIITIITLKNRISNITTDLVDMKQEIKKVGEVLIKMAITDQRVTNLERDVRELRHGDGFIRGVTGIDKEYL